LGFDQSSQAHKQYHIPEDLQRHGCHRNIHSAPQLHNHIHIKRAAHRTQKNKKTLDLQTGQYLMERLFIQRAFDYVSAHRPPPTICNIQKCLLVIVHQREHIVWSKSKMQMISTSAYTGNVPNMITLSPFIMTASFVILLHSSLQTTPVTLKVLEVQKCWSCHFLPNINVTDLSIRVTQTTVAMVHTTIGRKFNGMLVKIGTTG
jgi:hypothetical protein